MSLTRLPTYVKSFLVIKIVGFARTKSSFCLGITINRGNNECSRALVPDAAYANLIENAVQLNQLNQVHTQLTVSGLQCHGFLVTKLVNACTRLREISYACKLFDGFPGPDVYLWNAIIRCYSRHSLFRDAVSMYGRMQLVWANPDSFTFTCVLKACSGLPALEMGRRIQGQIFRHGFDSDVFVQNGLVTFYAKCGEIELANKVFGRLSDKTIVTWTSMISGYAQNGKSLEALRVYGQMRNTNLTPEWITFVSVLKAYTDIEGLEGGKCIHGCTIKMGFELVPDLVVALTAFYAKCGQVESPNLILWNAMISGYAKNGHAEEAVELFRRMVNKKVGPDSISVTSSISACGQVGSIELARWMDEYVANSEFKADVVVNTALIDMYAKCGSVNSSRDVFNRTGEKDVVMWSAMIAAYALHGQGQEAIDLFTAMRHTGVQPNDVTFVSLLSACNHSGLVEEGWKLFHCMREYGIEPRHQHYACVVDLLGRAGFLDRAYEFIRNMPIEPGVSVWGALLTACKIHRHVTLGEYAAERIFSLDQFSTGHHVQLSNIYASARMWDHVSKMRVLMKGKGLSKDLGYSSIEINGKPQVFQVGDKSHPRFTEILEKLVSSERRLKELGFFTDTESVLHDLNQEEIEETLCNHSERIAIAYGLISTPPGTTLRIIKNLRACVNCHAAIKLISEIENREIIVRDSNRFHHFKDGKCSCGDYWDIRNNRTALFDGIEEGGIRASSSYSHEINEQANEGALEGLQDRVNLLKRLSGDIHEEVEGHNRMLDGMGNEMDSSRGVLSGTMDRFKTVSTLGFL
ncbi:Pentatricopeptide repeat-containing protein At3g12770 [Linum perenne]